MSESESEISSQKLPLFQGKTIRRKYIKGEWYFSIVDILQALTESSNPRRYWSDLKSKISKQEGFAQLYEKIVQLKMESADGKRYATDAANTETLLRVIQSVPSPKAEPFKRWLAKVGYERIEEIQDPQKAQVRARALYKAKGYDDEWIEKRMRSIAIREELTDEWKQRGIARSNEYAILTAEISTATFGINPSSHKQLKGLKKENLRDHMTDLELIFSMLGEASTKEIAIEQDAKGFGENKKAAKSGGEIAGNARKELERKIQRSVVSNTNYKTQSQSIQDHSEESSVISIDVQ